MDLLCAEAADAPYDPGYKQEDSEDSDDEMLVGIVNKLKTVK